MATDGSSQIIDGGIEARTRQVFENIEAILAEAECTLADVGQCTCWIEDARDIGRFHAAYAELLTDPRARSTTVGQLVLDGKLEVEAIAYRPL
jgi:enamine deaminase RidA (YjgF/YER057c/UK114 family)